MGRTQQTNKKAARKQTAEKNPGHVKEVQISYVRHLKLEEKTCPQCSQRFLGVKKRRYCSRACQAKADYARHAEQYRQARMESYRRRKSESTKS